MHVSTEKVKGNSASDAKFSIVIPSWNNLAYLQLCIESIKKNSTYRHEIIVHINEGVDGTLEWVKAQPDISYSYSKNNIGVCYALNSCRTLVTTKYLLYINDDMYVCPGWDAPLTKAIEETGHNLFFFSSTAIELKAQSNCSILHDFGKDITSFDEARQLHVTLKANRINEIRNPHFVAPYTPWSASASTLSVRTDVAEPNLELYNSIARVAGSGTGTIELSIVHTFKAGDQIYVTGLGSPFDGLKTLTSVSDFTVSFAASGTVASAASTVGVVCKGGDALVITSSGTSQVILKSFVTTADLMDIHYPDTTYTFSLYAKTEQSSDVVIPSIVWYDINKTIIST